MKNFHGFMLQVSSSSSMPGSVFVLGHSASIEVLSAPKIHVKDRHCYSRFNIEKKSVCESAMAPPRFLAQGIKLAHSRTTYYLNVFANGWPVGNSYLACVYLCGFMSISVSVSACICMYAGACSAVNSTLLFGKRRHAGAATHLSGALIN